MKPVYTAADLESMEHLNYAAGIAPFLHGPYATMYVMRPWTIRQYAGFVPTEGNDVTVVGMNHGHAPCELRVSFRELPQITSRRALNFFITTEKDNCIRLSDPRFYDDYGGSNATKRGYVTISLPPESIFTLTSLN